MNEQTSGDGDSRPDSGDATAVAEPPVEASSVTRSFGLKLVESVFKSTDGAESDVFSPDNFKQVEGGWWLDRMLPGSATTYFGMAFAVCSGVWLIGLVLRLLYFGFEDIPGEVWRFVLDRQWQLQPLLLFIHFVCLRLFRAIYSGTFLKAFTHLDVKDEELEQHKVWFFGKRVNLFALVIAAPFIIWDVVLFRDVAGFYQILYGADSAFVARLELTSHMPEAWFMLGIWAFEWLIYGYYCYLMIAGALVVRMLLKRHKFIETVDLVLTERQYRPLFNVTAQAGSLVFIYGLLHLGYVLYSKSAWSDVAGLVLLIVVLGVAFVTTWSSVRGVLKGSVDEVVEALEKSYRETRAKLLEVAEHPGIQGDLLRVQVQLKMQLALQQLDYIQGKYENLGRREFLGLMFKMLAPVGTVLARVIRWGSILAAFGLGSAAAFGTADRARQALGGQPRAETQQEAPAEPGQAEPAPRER
jgi:hypothetical protein